MGTLLYLLLLVAAGSFIVHTLIVKAFLIVHNNAISKVNAELVICSLNLLGFNPDDYIVEYVFNSLIHLYTSIINILLFRYTYFYGYSYGLLHLTGKTFDKQNEKTLMVILHFLITGPLNYLLKGTLYIICFK